MRNKILNEIHDTVEILGKLEKIYSDDDIRKSFYDGHFTFLCGYLINYDWVINEKNISPYDEILNCQELKRNEINENIKTFRNLSNSTLIIHSWSNFELLISFLTENFFDTETKESLMEQQYNSISKILLKEQIDIKTIPAFEKCKNSSFHKIALNNKLLKLLQLIKNKNKEYVKEMEDFLLNFARIRNCIHSNYIYFGNDTTYIFDEKIFHYIPNEPINILPNSDDIYLKLCIQLRKYTNFIIDNVEYKETIIDPTSKYD